MFIPLLLTILIAVRFTYPALTAQAVSLVITPTPPTSIPLPTSAPLPTYTPTPIPTTTPILSPQSEFESLFDESSKKYGVDKELLKRIARCESGFNPESKNGTYGGMFQFAEGTWVTTRSEMGKDTHTDLRFSAQDAIETAAFKMGKHGTDAWVGCL